MKPINKSVVETLVVNTFFEKLFSAKTIPRVVNKIYMHEQARKKDIPPYIISAKKQLNEVEKEISNIVTAIGRGMYHESMKTRMDELEAEKAAIIIRIDEAQRQSEVNSRTKDEIKSFLARFSNIREMDPEDQKAAVELFVYRVTVFDDYINVDVSPWASPNGGPWKPHGPGPLIFGDDFPDRNLDGSWDTSGIGPPPPED